MLVSFNPAIFNRPQAQRAKQVSHKGEMGDAKNLVHTLRCEFYCVPPKTTKDAAVAKLTAAKDKATGIVRDYLELSIRNFSNRQVN